MYIGTFPPIDNREDWVVDYSIIEDDTGEPLDLTGIAEIEIVVRDQDSKRIELSGSLSGGEVILTDGTEHTVTVTIASPAVVAWDNHQRGAGDPVILTTTGALPTGLAIDTIYYVIEDGLTDDMFQISEQLGGDPVNTTGTQSGTHTATAGPIGTMQWNFPEASVKALCAAKTYEIGGRVTGADGSITTFIRARLPVLDGIFEG